MKIQAETTITNIATMNRDSMISLDHADVDSIRVDEQLFASTEESERSSIIPFFVRQVEFGCSLDRAKQVHVGQKVRITIEVLSDE